MTTYEKNLQVLAKYYPEMDGMIQEAKEQMKPLLEIVEEYSLDGERILKIKKDNRVCYLNGKRNTTESAQIWVHTLGKLQRNTPVLIMGIGNDTYLRELVEKTENRITIIVYEPSLQIFLKFLEKTDIEHWLEKHVIIFWVDGLKDMDEKHMKGMLQQILRYEMLDNFVHLILPNYETLFKGEAIKFMRICRDIALNEVSRYNTNKLFSNVMVKNLLSNMKFLYKGYKTTQMIDVIPRDIPGIVVAAGPSLNKNIQELKKAKGKAFIVAVDTAMKPLLQAGIVPDMFAVIDALKPVELVDIEQAKNVPLLTTLNAASQVLEYHTGKKFFFNEGYLLAEKIFEKSGQIYGGVASGGSVATHIFSFLHKIGLSTIILVGQDLAYTDNKSHADGTFHEVMEEVDTSQFMMVEGNYEEKVPTRMDFKLFLDWYNMYIEGVQEFKEDFRVINATEGGAKIRNTELMTLQEAIQKECKKEVNINDCLEKLSPMLDEEGRKWAVEYLRNIQEEFRQLKIEARNIKKSYQKLDKVCDKRNIDKKEYLSIMKKLEKQIKIIEKDEVYQLVVITMTDALYILQNEQYLQEDSLQKEGKEMARKGMLYMENVEKCATLFGNYAEEIFSDLA